MDTLFSKFTQQTISHKLYKKIIYLKRFHRIELLAVKKNFTLRVDGGLARSIVNEGKNEFLDVRR